MAIFMKERTGADGLSHLTRANSDDGDKFVKRYNEYFPRMYAYLYGRLGDKELARDIAAEVFEKAFTKSATLRSEDAFGAWIFTIARNAVASYWRKNRSRAELAQDMGDQLDVLNPSPEESLMEQEQIAALMRFVRQMGQREQDILALKFDAELGNREIAEIMHLSEVNVRVIFYRTLKKLREMMSGG